MAEKRLSVTNIQVKQDMYQALLRLMKGKAFSAISISDITAEAGVSRMAFYRNYSAIEEILIEHLTEVVEEYRREDIDVEDEKKVFYDKKYMLHCFRFFYVQREFINSLIASGMGDIFLAKITEYMIRKWINESNRTRERVLKISAYAGSIYNMYREWSKEGFQESSETVAEILNDLNR